MERHHYFIASAEVARLSAKRPDPFAYKFASARPRYVSVMLCYFFATLEVIHILLSVAYAENWVIKIRDKKMKYLAVVVSFSLLLPHLRKIMVGARCG